MKHIIVKKVFCKYDCNFIMLAIKDFVGIQKDLHHCTAKLLSRQITHACVLLVVRDGHHHGRQDTLADTETEQIPICTNPYTMQEKLTNSNRTFLCKCKTMHLNTVRKLFTKHYKMKRDDHRNIQV